jgi:uncharacterized protein (TIGR04255 family)
VAGEVAQAEAPKPMWTPIKGNHAINSCTAVVTFAQPVTDDLMAEILRVSRSLSSQLVLENEAPEQTFQVSFSQDEAGQGQLTSSATFTGSVIFFRKEADETVSERLTVGQNSIKFETMSYVRWVGFRRKLELLTSALLPLYRQVAQLSVISLEYVDVFVGNPTPDLDCSVIINTRSNSVANNAIQNFGQWHSNTGWFEKSTSSNRVLVNMDVGVSDQLTALGIQRLAVIRSMESMQLDISSDDGQYVSDRLPSQWVVDTLHELHLSLKSRLADVLTPEGQTMIKLEAGVI